MSTLTQKQAAAWTAAMERVDLHAGYSLPHDIRKWDVVYAEESRPGRGHHINATYIDGEVFAQVLMDVYGYPSISVALLAWVHADSNEECDCEPCEVERRDAR